MSYSELSQPNPDYPGLFAIGGELTPATLTAAYRRGVFPWFGENDPILWWSPDPRAIFELDSFYISRRLLRTLRSNKFRCTFDTEFAAVVRGCTQRSEGTWITPDLMKAFEQLHEQGLAHSIEVWQGDQLAGGLFGTAIGGFFAGESMFHTVRDASKVALAVLVERLQKAGFLLFDIQVLTPHTASLGASEISRAEYLQRLQQALECQASF